MEEGKTAKMEEQKPKRRISRKQKTEIVLALLRGDSIEELSRTHHLAVHEITTWRDVFIQFGSEGFKRRSGKGGRESELERIIGRQQMDIELLKKRTRGFGKGNGTI